MKLHLVPARTGLQWVKLGVKTFFRQPLAMSGLFFMFMATVSVLSLIPFLGTVISLALVPAATLGLMAATREAVQGRFPMPSALISGLRGTPVQTRNMLILGALYAAGLLLVLGVATLFAGEATPPLDPNAADVTAEVVRASLANQGLLAGLVVYLPVLMAFWHAPALVHWHGVSPGKSLFFSFMACWGNKGAMLIYSLGWVGVFMLVGLLMSLLGAFLGGVEALSIVLYPAVLFMASMFHASIYFTFVDSFESAERPTTPITNGEDA
ncbi:BPSS1780 family membrane protein [Hydrogenophaga sp.]|uniref:BPSS1780 family membrane protein n=1 Tax=Hydrogenophaga sp. TaxID=1904254 RepID=UPI00272FCACF|nr:BPSS1780 family membrane protein [Hydrogenophaga sp.]MDP2016759.1 BPSS1780 family membrane protein [Hydrogenophaga sp.]MDP3165490.1 BPSS1780 family membrane protein [Hydrogenophaga sp.]MDP3812073.1 BPSS1780 family membrane protein [Hydrogenophaga sp.]